MELRLPRGSSLGVNEDGNAPPHHSLADESFIKPKIYCQRPLPLLMCTVSTSLICLIPLYDPPAAGDPAGDPRLTGAHPNVRHLDLTEILHSHLLRSAAGWLVR